VSFLFLANVVALSAYKKEMADNNFHNSIPCLTRARKLSKSLLILLITRYGKNKENALQISKFQLVLHPKLQVMMLGQVE